MRFNMHTAAGAAAAAAALGKPQNPSPCGGAVDVGGSAGATPTPLPGMPGAGGPIARVLMSTAGRVMVGDLTETGMSLSIDEKILGDPSWMAFAEPNLLYAVDEWSAAMRLFHLDLETNKLELVTEKNASAGVVHLEFNADQTRMVGASYGDGTVDVWDVEGGKLELLKTVKSDGKLGPNTERQAAAHPHQTNLDPTGRYFAVNDLGTDEIMLLDSKDDAFDVVNRVRVEPAGCGPRHGVFYPSIAMATHYLVGCEMKNVVVLYSLTYSPAGKGIEFKREHEISTFNPDKPPKDAAKAALGEIVMAGLNDIYVSNRLTGEKTDSIVHLKLNPFESKLSFAGEFSSGGLLPRMMSVSDSGRELLVATQDGPAGVSVLQRTYFNGNVASTPKATLESKIFGEAGAGPKYIKQIA